MAKSLTLRTIPADVFKIVLQEQGRIKNQRGVGKFGIEQTLYSIIREWKRCREENTGKP